MQVHIPTILGHEWINEESILGSFWVFLLPIMVGLGVAKILVQDL